MQNPNVVATGTANPTSMVLREDPILPAPSAVASYVLATHLKGDTALAATTNGRRTLLSGLALGGVLLLG